MDADIRELTCDLEFLFKFERYARGLFPVAERSVKNSYFFMCGAIGKEDDPLQHPCEQSYTHYENADYLKKSCTIIEICGFLLAQYPVSITIRLIGNYS